MRGSRMDDNRHGFNGRRDQRDIVHTRGGKLHQSDPEIG
jgi:hypothetical protein